MAKVYRRMKWLLPLLVLTACAGQQRFHWDVVAAPVRRAGVAVGINADCGPTGCGVMVLSAKNESGVEARILWSQTRYFHNGKDMGPLWDVKRQAPRQAPGEEAKRAERWSRYPGLVEIKDGAASQVAFVAQSKIRPGPGAPGELVVDVRESMNRVDVDGLAPLYAEMYLLGRHRFDVLVETLIDRRWVSVAVDLVDEENKIATLPELTDPPSPNVATPDELIVLSAGSGGDGSAVTITTDVPVHYRVQTTVGELPVGTSTLPLPAQGSRVVRLDAMTGVVGAKSVPSNGKPYQLTFSGRARAEQNAPLWEKLMGKWIPAATTSADDLRLMIGGKGQARPDRFSLSIYRNLFEVEGATTAGAFSFYCSEAALSAPQELQVFTCTFKTFHSSASHVGWHRVELLDGDRIAVNGAVFVRAKEAIDPEPQWRP